jgi:hypothetical protein
MVSQRERFGSKGIRLEWMWMQSFYFFKKKKGREKKGEKRQERKKIYKLSSV